MLQGSPIDEKIGQNVSILLERKKTCVCDEILNVLTKKSNFSQSRKTGRREMWVELLDGMSGLAATAIVLSSLSLWKMTYFHNGSQIWFLLLKWRQGEKTVIPWTAANDISVIASSLFDLVTEFFVASTAEPGELSFSLFRLTWMRSHFYRFLCCHRAFVGKVYWIDSLNRRRGKFCAWSAHL